MSFMVGDSVVLTDRAEYVHEWQRAHFPLPKGAGTVAEIRPEQEWPYVVWFQDYPHEVFCYDYEIERAPSSFNDAFGEYYVTAKSQQTVPGFSPLVTREGEMKDSIQVAPASEWTDTPDMVNHPPHYTRGGIEVLDFILAYFADDYLLGQVVKYTARSGHKWDTLEDLEKAAFYLNRKIEEVKKGNTND